MHSAESSTIDINAIQRMAQQLARRLMPPPASAAAMGIEATDLVSQAVLAGLSAIDSFRPQRDWSLRVWVLMKMRFAIREQIRVAAHQAPDEWRVDLDDVDKKRADADTGPEALSLREDTARRLRRCVGMLEPRRREIITLYYWGNLHFSQIGKRLGVSESRVCWLHWHAIARLRAWMEP